MSNPIRAIPIILGQRFKSQALARVPEPSAAMTDEESVEEFNHALESKLVIAYAGAIELIHQARRAADTKRAVDLCCGPGQFTLFLAKHLGYEEVIGIDLSPQMIEKARENAAAWGLEDRVRFEVGDVLDDSIRAHGTFDLVTCNDAAHHMPSLEMVGQLFQSMDHLAAAEGLVLMMDMVRLKTESLTDRYTEFLGADYKRKNWHRFYEDFCNSMRACWTVDEFKSQMPGQSESRRWQSVVQRLLPTVQFGIGFPNDGNALRVRSGFPWSKDACPVPKSMRGDWKLFRALLSA